MCRYTYAFAITAFQMLLKVQSAASLYQNKTGPPPPPAGFRSRRLREKLRLTTVTLGGGKGGVREGHAGFIGELFQGWKYIYEWGRLKRFHFFETEHVAVRRFYWRFISVGLKPRRGLVGKEQAFAVLAFRIEVQRELSLAVHISGQGALEKQWH